MIINSKISSHTDKPVRGWNFCGPSRVGLLPMEEEQTHDTLANQDDSGGVDLTCWAFVYCAGESSSFQQVEQDDLDVSVQRSGWLKKKGVIEMAIPYLKRWW